MMRKSTYYVGRLFSKGYSAYWRTSFMEKLKVALYSLLSFVGCLFFFTRPIFAVANMNCGEMISKTGKFNIHRSFKGVADPKRYIPLLAFYFIRDLMILVVAFAIICPYFVFTFINELLKEKQAKGLLDGYTFSKEMADKFSLGLLIGLGVIALIVTIIILVRYGAASYIAKKEENPDLSTIMYKNSDATANHGKWAYFITTFVPLFIIGMYMSICIIIINVIVNYSEAQALTFLSPIVFFIFIVVGIFLFPQLGLGLVTVHYEISNGIISDKEEIVGEVTNDGEIVSIQDKEKNPEAK